MNIKNASRLLANLALAAIVFFPSVPSSLSFAQDTSDAVDRHLASTVSPGGLQGSSLPQFILVTFDDGINSFAESFIQPVIGQLKNPDGTHAPVTYFVTKVNTDSLLARQQYLEGNEIANHTATHSTNGTTPYSQWIWELGETNRFFVNAVGIPSKEIAGFRAPDLLTDNDMWRALKDLHFTYDASLSEIPTVPPTVSTGMDSLIWPYTFDNGAKTACLAESCPDTSIPGLWSIPIWDFFDSTGSDLGSMDPAVGFDSVFNASLEYLFEKRYHGNRCPLGIYLHAGQLWSPTRQAILRTFLEQKLHLPDVWMITMRGLIEWIRHPVPTQNLSAWFAGGRYRGLGNSDAEPPGPSTPVSPDDSARVTGTSVQLLWDVVLTASGYEVQVSSDPQFASLLLDTLGLTKSTFPFPSPSEPGKYFWRARAWNTKGTGPWTQTRSFSVSQVTSARDQSPLPTLLTLEQNYPNPFNPKTVISGQWTGNSEVRLEVFDILGRKVATLADGRYSAGKYAFTFDGTNLASGMYLYRLTAGSYSAVRKMLLIR